MAGLLGAGLTTWVTFAPCFGWIFAFAPWIDRLAQATKLKGGLAAVTAAVVGVIASLAVWFAWNVIFPAFDTSLPGWGFDWRAALLALLAAMLVFGAKWGVIRVLAVCAVGGLLLSLA